MLNVTRCLLFLLLCFFTANLGIAQQSPAFNCAFDDLLDAAQEPDIQLFEQQLNQYFLQKKATSGLQDSGSGMPYVVPVVVHIIHNGGPENISDARVIAAIGHMNEAFAAQGYFAQQGATVNTQIQFCLAKRDPNGNATTGITRTQSALTDMIMETQDLATKDLSRWDPTQYVNIWVVKEITSLSQGPGVAGYAYFPSTHGQPIDGMICEAQFFGASPAQDAVLVHEMGHYFGLYHTFQGGCKNDDCTVDGDRVCDTPPDNATHTNCTYNSCSTDVAPGSPFSTDVDDFTGDFMDYSPFQCYHFFTAGQAARMQGTVETARKSLLSSKGCTDPCTQPITAAFSAAPNPAFAGQPVLLTNNSTGATSFFWSENGIVFSQNQDASQIFNALGNYLITLKATNSDPNCSDSTQTIVQVLCPVVADFSVTKYEILPGESLDFTNISTGGATDFEWFINGFSLATTTDFSFQFPNPGYYTVVLKASGTFCATEKAIQIQVKAPCGDQVNVETRYSNGPTALLPIDMVALPDGSLIQVGQSANHPMMTRLDAAGNVMWHKVVDGDGVFNNIEMLPNGTFILRGEMNTKLLLAQMEDNGNFLWYKTLENSEVNFTEAAGSDYLAVNPDGSFFFYFRFGGIGKVSSSGDVEWLRRLNLQGGNCGGIRIATDGSNDLLVTSSIVISGLGYVVNRISQNGDWVATYHYELTDIAVNYTSNPLIATHAGGDFSLLFMATHTDDYTLIHKYVLRCQPDGQVRWAKKIGTPGVETGFLVARNFPDQGWLLTDYKNNLDNYLVRLSDSGDVLWQQKIGSGGVVGDAVLASVFQNGMIRGMKWDLSSKQMSLLQMPDAYFQTSCLPDIPLTDTVGSASISWTALPATLSPLHQALELEPYSFLPAAVLSRNVLCSSKIPCLEICDNGLDDDGDGLVDCLDIDCSCFDPDTACVVNVPTINNFSAKLAWQSTVNAAHAAGIPIVANLNPQQDSLPEIIVLESKGSVYPTRILIFRGDGSDASSPNTLTIPQSMSYNLPMHPMVADLDGNGVPELVVVDLDGYISVYTDFNPGASPCMNLWAVSDQPAASRMGRVYAADFDSDGLAEVFSGNRVFKLDLTNPASPKLKRVLSGLGATGKLGGVDYLSLSSTAADLLTPADCNGDPDCNGLEIAAGPHIYSIDLDLTDGDGYEIKVQRNLSQLDTTDIYLDGYTSIADLDLDGTPEIIVSSGPDISGDGFYFWNKNGVAYRFMHSAVQRMIGMICVADVYDDRKAGFAQNFPELIVCQEYGLFCFNLQKAQTTPDQPFWWSLPTTDKSGITGVTVFDFNGDGISEIVYRDEDHLRILYGGPAPFPAGVDAERNWYKTITGSLTLDEYPVVADVDNDGAAEIVVTGYLVSVLGNHVAFNYNSRLRVFESADLPWQHARPIWNQYNYFGVNIKDDLSVPKVQQKHWLEVGGIGSGNRPFNTHLAQVSSLNPLATNKTKVPDATMALDSSQCRVDSVDLYFSICNFGSTALPSGTPIAFYASDPTSSAAPLLFPPVILNETIEKGVCITTQLSIPAIFNQAVFVVVNDNGSLPRPFNLDVNFPSTGQQECHYDNNMASFLVQHQTPLLDLGPDINLCQNSVVELAANPGFEKYRWQDGSTEPNFTAYTAGKYWVDVFDACGFKQTDTVTIELNTLKLLDLPETIVVCEGETVPLAASGFSKYSWAPDNLVSCPDCASIDVLAQNAITIYLTAADNNCFVSDSVRIQVLPKPTVQLLAQDGDCGALASITTTVLGAGPFSFQWSDASTDSILTTTQAGVYTVEITDINGCSSVDSAGVVLTNLIVLSAQLTDPICANSPTGAIHLNLDGASTPIQYLWSNNATTAALTDVLAGSYSVVVTDANGCTATLSKTLSDPPALVLSVEKTEPNCAGQASGTLDLTAGGGTGNLQFSWSNNSTTEDLNALPAGIYSATITDENGCTAMVSETLTDPPAIVLSAEKTEPNCAGQASGTLDLTATGGTGSLQIKWSNNSVTEDLGALQAGTYTATVTDENGCMATISETLTDPPSLLLSAEETDPACAGANSGAINLSASGGTGTLQFLWSNNADTEDLDALPAGMYSATITDANGCTASISATLNAPPAIALSLEKTDPNCAGQASGTLDLSAAGGTGNFQFNWSNNATSEDVGLLPAGTYSATITDENGCTASISETLIDPPAIVLQLQSTVLSCPGDTGQISLTASGGTPPFTFLWSTGSTTASIQVMQAGTYTITSTDSKGCTLADEAVVAVLGTPPSISLQTDTLTCIKPSGLLSAQSDLPNCSFWWSGPGGFSSQEAAPAVSTSGQYLVTVTEPMGGCSAVGSIWVPVDSTAPTIILAAPIVEIPCNQSAVTISAAGSSSGQNYAIQWDAPSGGTILNGANSLSLSVGSSGFYDLLITNLSNGCTATAAVEVLQAEPVSGLVIADSVRCFGEANGAIRVVSTVGGTLPLSYSIDHQTFQSEPVFENLTAGVYQLVLRDAKGCTFTTETQVGQPAPIAVELTGDSLVIRGTEANLTAIIYPPDLVLAQIGWEASGAALVQNQLEQSVRLLENTIFQIEITAENGCTAVDTKLVRVDEHFKIYIPNVIFPENPKGANQTFLIFAGPETLKIESLEIFDRWGNLVFSNKNFLPNEESAGWDGTYKGKTVGAGVYVWVAKIVFQDDTTEVLKGGVTVLR